MDKDITVMTYLFPLPVGQKTRGGTFIHNTCKHLQTCGFNVNVVLFLPLNYLFALKSKHYNVGEIRVLVIYYIPRLSKLYLKLDVFLKRANIKFNQIINKKYFSKKYFYQTIYPSFALASATKHASNFVIARGSDVNVEVRNNQVKALIKKNIAKTKPTMLAVSKTTAQAAINNIGVDLEFDYLHTSCDERKFTSTHDVAGLNNIYFVGHLSEKKGIRELIEAFREIYKLNPNARLNIVGKGPLEEEIKTNVNALNLESVITLLGQQAHDKLPSIINQQDILIFPSWAEGLPNVVVEAVFSKRIVIATNVGGTAEISQENAGFQLVTPKSSHALVDAYKALLDSNINTVQKDLTNNREYALQKFSIEAHQKTLSRTFL